MLKNINFLSRLIKFFGLLLLIISFLAVNDVQAQRKSKGYLKRKNRKVSKYKGGSIHFDKNKRYLSGGISIDGVNYFGDVTPKSSITSTDLSFTRSGLSMYGYFRYAPNLSFRGSFSWARLKGDDFKSADPYGEESSFRYVRNLSFRNDIKELALVGIWDIFGNHGTFLNRVSFTPYVFGGVGVFHHNPKAKAPELDKFGQALAEAGEWVALRDLGTEGQLSPHYDVKQYSVIQASIPFGLGIRAKLNKRMDFEFEVGYRYLFTDYVDDVSGLYVDLGALDSELARAMSDRSREPTSVNFGDPRDFEAINAVTNLITYTSEFDNRDYTVYAGYGHYHETNTRGLASQNDIYIVTSFKLAYIITGSFKRAKFR
ncbi:MAG: hypothetical protein KAI99_08610 [Cyclobacteriaceae bacterium]|nr:hypothetical protein [Cyclobacteriaceae bacterium]